MLRKNAFLILIIFVSLAATTATLTISGQVLPSTSIQVEGVGNHSSLNISSGVEELEVAKISAASNMKSGYTITVMSSNGGLLKSGDQLGPKYTATFDSSPISLNNRPVTAFVSNNHTDKKGKSHSLKVSFKGSKPGYLKPGSYSDTLTFSIKAN